MKKLFLLFILVCTSFVQSLATDWTDANGVTWTFSLQDYWYDDNGDGNSTSHYYYTITAVANYGDELTIPETVYDGVTPRTIEAIGSNVFKDNRTLSSVTLPSTVKCINYQAFRGCTALTTVEGTANCERIEWEAFQGCSSLAAIDLSNCYYLGRAALQECSSLVSVGSIAHCKTIDSSAFYECFALQSVDLGGNVRIGSWAFCNCSNLGSVGSLIGATIGERAFHNCRSLTTIDLSQAASLGNYAFQSCYNLTSVGDLAAFTAIPDYAFQGCSKLESVNLSNCRSIGQYAFQSCQKLEQVDLSKVTNIGQYAFSSCSALETVGDISTFTAIPNGLFSGCTKLKNLSLPNVTTIGSSAFSGCASITMLDLPNVTAIGEYSFSGCSSITTVDLPKVTTIGSGAFSNCSLLNEPNITSTTLTSIGDNAFNTPGTITLLTVTPPTLGSNNAFGTLMVVRVPDSSVGAYRTAEMWSDFKSRIVGIGAQLSYIVNVTAQADKSGLAMEIGEANLGQVVTLKVSGTINGYDIMVMRNKMDNLHYIDLTDANIVANDYEYYTGYHTEDNILGENSFYQLVKLLEVKLPKTITSIGNSAFYGCLNLKNVVFQPGIVDIGYSAFCACGNLMTLELKEGLKSIGSYAFAEGSFYMGNTWYTGIPKFEQVILPEGLETIGSSAFYNNSNLKRIAFPSTLSTIGYSAFYGCNQLTSISLPTSLQNIDESTFKGCSSLSEVRIPSSIHLIGDKAFSECPQLNDVYTYIAEPTQINMNTFSTYETATLHVPSTSYYNYWYDTEWSQFRTLEDFDAEYEYFYINKDFVVSDDAGTIQGDGENDPDADLNPGSGFIIETGENNKQELNELHIKMKDSDCASVITASNLVANKVYFDIEIQKGRWYFFCFPFNVKTVNIEAPGNYVFRVYDPEERANGKTGWVNWIGDLLYKGQGYIFHCSKAGTLTLCVEKEDQNWTAENRPKGLAAAPAENPQDASWNFIGNPHTSYYDIDKTGYTQPITVWNGTSYEAVRPGDDDYCLSPFEGFFVQKPDGQNEMNFPAGEEATDGRYTQIQWNESQTNRAAARRAKGVDVDRQMINLILTDGQTTDKTRVVFNQKQTQQYEIACDAAKFISSEAIPQLYTLDQKNTKYAINERPMGEVRLGYTATKEGQLTIRAIRMDQPVLLRDNMLQITHDLTLGDYAFSSKPGTFDDRFMLLTSGNTTGVGQLRQETGVSVLAEKGGINFSGVDQQDVSVYSLNGIMLAGHVGNGFLQLPQATYIVKIDAKTTKLIVR